MKWCGYHNKKRKLSSEEVTFGGVELSQKAQSTSVQSSTWKRNQSVYNHKTFQSDGKFTFDIYGAAILCWTCEEVVSSVLYHRTILRTKGWVTTKCVPNVYHRTPSSHAVCKRHPFGPLTQSVRVADS